MPPIRSYILFGLIALIVCGLIVFAVARRNRQKQHADGIVSLVFLLREPRTLELAEIRNAAERAFGTDVEVILTDRPKCFIVTTPEITLGLANVDGPYVEDVGAASDLLRDFLCKKAMQEHRAWLAVDQIGEPPAGGPAISYGYIGKLMAELADNDCLALYSTLTSQMNSYGPDLLPLLRGPNPLEALSQPREDEIVSVDQHDEDMIKAVAEAKRRWPEFVSTFKKRRPMQGFAVKVPFHEGEGQEFMWVEVSKLEGDKIHGNLVSEPKLISKLKLDDKVIVSLDDLNDWIYSDGKEMVGGFTSKVLEQKR